MMRCPWWVGKWGVVVGVVYSPGGVWLWVEFIVLVGCGCGLSLLPDLNKQIYCRSTTQFNKINSFINCVSV